MPALRWLLAELLAAASITTLLSFIHISNLAITPQRAIAGVAQFRQTLSHADLHGIKYGHRTRGCVVYLAASNERDVFDLSMSLSLLEQHYLKRYPVPVFIFHDGLSDAIQTQIISTSRTNLTFIRVSLSMPLHTLWALPWWLLSWEAVSNAAHKRSLFSYGSMCRFFSGELFAHSALSSFDYVLRVDTDSKLQGTVSYDLFQALQDRSALYGTVAATHDDPLWTRGLVRTTADFALSHGINPAVLVRYYLEFRREGRVACSEAERRPADGNLRDPNARLTSQTDLQHRVLSFVSNFEVVSVPFMRSPEVQSFFRHLDDQHGWYRFRWGDAPVRFLELGLFASENAVAFFCDVQYEHGGFTYPVNSSAHLTCPAADYPFLAAERVARCR